MYVNTHKHTNLVTGQVPNTIDPGEDLFLRQYSELLALDDGPTQFQFPIHLGGVVGPEVCKEKGCAFVCDFSLSMVTVQATQHRFTLSLYIFGIKLKIGETNI